MIYLDAAATTLQKPSAVARASGYAMGHMASPGRGGHPPAMLAADTFHTFAEWKRMGYSVKKGQHAALTCQLWKYTDKPGKAAREAAEAAGQDTPETDPHFYMTKAHLFHALQVEKSKR